MTFGTLTLDPTQSVEDAEGVTALLDALTDDGPGAVGAIARGWVWPAYQQGQWMAVVVLVTGDN